MEKLIELLNEYDGAPTEWKQIGDKIYFDGLGGNSELHELIIISKYYGFIKRLVDNDKIEFREDFYLEDQHGGGFGEDENIIMLLSIQDNPLDFLVKILK